MLSVSPSAPAHSLSATAPSPVKTPSSRKRTMSFTSTQPMKVPRPLKRTGSYLSLPDIQSSGSSPHHRASSSTSTITDCSSRVPYNRTLRYYKEQRDKQRKATLRPVSCSPTSVAVVSQPIVAQPKPAKPVVVAPPRASSPLSPVRATFPPRACFPRSKPEPDLYRLALTTRLRMSPGGQQIIHMGPRLAFSIHEATQELERLVAAQKERGSDVVMATAEAALSNSWVVVPTEDWEMVECAC